MKKSKILLALTVVLLIGTAIYLLPLDPNIVYLQLAFNKESFNNVLSEWQPDGVAHYLSHFPVDFLLLITYATFGYLLGREHAALFPGNPWLKGFFIWALPLAAIADATENLFHIMLVKNSIHSDDYLYIVSGCAATTKFIFIFVFLICLLFVMKEGSKT